MISVRIQSYEDGIYLELVMQMLHGAIYGYSYHTLSKVLTRHITSPRVSTQT